MEFLQLYINSRILIVSSSLYESLHGTLNEHAPIKNKSIILRNSFKWFIPELMLSKITTEIRKNW